MLSAGGASSFALQCVWFLALGFWVILAVPVMQASPECCILSVATAGEEGGAVLPPFTDLREKEGVYSEHEFMWEEK